MIGAGLNGLTLANYLLRAGLRVLVIERRLESGGGLSSEEPALTGYWANTGHYVFDTLDLLPFHEELGLAEANVRFVRPDVQSALPLDDGRALVIYRDLERTLRSIATFSAKDAATWRRLHRAAVTLPELAPIALRRPAKAAPSRDPELARTSRMSPREVLDELFESEVVKSLVLHHLLVPRGIGLDDSGTGHFVPFAIARAGHGHLVHEGSHELAQGLWTVILKRGGDVWDFTEATGIVVEKGRAVGVEMAGGQRVRARTVVSTLDPAATFRLTGEQYLKRELVDRLRRVRPDALSLFTVHLALREAPRFRAAAGTPDVDRAFRYGLGLPSVEDHDALWHDVRRGVLPSSAAMFVSVPSVHDPGQAPRDHHTALVWRFVPRRLRGQEWKDVREPFMNATIERLRNHAPNLAGHAIAGAATMTPDDLVAKFPNLAPGLFGGRNAGGQLGAFRPVPELGGFRAPIAGLYLAGAAMPPGAGLSPAPALACLEVLAADLGITRWWARK